MKDAVIVDGVRTPSGNHGGALRPLLAKELLALVFKGILERTKIDPASIDEVIAGCIAQPSDAPNIARVSALMAGVPKETPALTVARNCNSGMDAIVEAWRRIQLDEGSIYLVGGVESMSNIPYIIKDARWGLKIRHSQLTDGLWEGLTDPICGQLMGRTAENLVEEFGLTRLQQDEYAVQSHKKAFAATRTGKFKDEIVPVEITKKVAGQEVAKEQITQDETINAGSVRAESGDVSDGLQAKRIGDTGQCVRHQRRRERDVDHERGEGRRTRLHAAGESDRLRLRGRRAGAHGHRPGVRRAQSVGQSGQAVERHGLDRDQRSVRGASAGLRAQTAVGLEQGQRQRRRDRARPSRRIERRAHRRDAGA